MTSSLQASEPGSHTWTGAIWESIRTNWALKNTLVPTATTTTTRNSQPPATAATTNTSNKKSNSNKN